MRGTGDTSGRSGGWGGRLLRGTLLFLAGGLVGANVVYYLVGQRDAGCAPCAGAASPAAAPPAGRDGVPAGPSTARPSPTRPVAPAEVARSPDGALVIPVAGIRPDDLVDTYTQSRGSGRLHDAIDIMAPAGTPVLAAVDGRVAKLFQSAAGGITLYQFDRAERFVYYYAHLQGYAPGMVEGRVLRQGEVLGTVGSTGNADPAGPHLHFSISRLDTDKRWHAGTPINPYPLLSGRPAAVPEPAPAAVPASPASPQHAPAAPRPPG